MKLKKNQKKVFNSPIKNKCPENVRKIAGKLSRQIPDKFRKLNVQKLFQKGFIFQRSEFVRNQFLSSFCPEFVWNLSGILNGKCPENIQISHFNFSQIYSLISAEFIIKFQSNLELNISQIYI